MQASKRKVLIVEDEFILYDELVEFFQDRGYSIIGHPNGKAVDTYDDAVKLLTDNEPDIAVLDIDIRGKKDGLELAAFIQEHFYTLIIILSGHGNHENLERARLINADGFVLKATKPINLDQLWASIVIKLPRLDERIKKKNQGEFFKVREIDIKQVNNRQSSYRHEADPLDIETFIKWDNITHIVSYNSKTAGEGNNNILIHTVLDNKGYVHRSSLNDIAAQLPIYFVRFDQSTIVNFRHITAKGRGHSLYFIGDKPFKLSDRFKEAALEKINVMLGNKI